MNEKRRYFRIQDSIGLALRAARVQQPTLKLSDADTVADAELRAVDSELNTLVNAIWGEDPKVAKSFGLLNRKIEILSTKKKVVTSKKHENFDTRYHNLLVSLSASGIGFVSDNFLQVGERLELMLLLAPANMRMVIKGSVIECAALQQDDAVRYQVRIDFELNAAEEEQLIQHIVQRQIQLIGQDNSE